MSCISVERFSISRVGVVDEAVLLELYGLAYLWGWTRVCGIPYHGHIDRRSGRLWCRTRYHLVTRARTPRIGNRAGDRCSSTLGGPTRGGLCWIRSRCTARGIICEKWKISLFVHNLIQNHVSPYKLIPWYVLYGRKWYQFIPHQRLQLDQIFLLWVLQTLIKWRIIASQGLEVRFLCRSYHGLHTNFCLF